MKKSVLLIAMSLCLSLGTMAQSRFNVSGTLIDKETSEAIISGTIQLLSLPDSTFVKGVITGADGSFELKDIPKASYTFKISYVGYVTKYVELDLNKQNNRRVNIGYITLASDAIMLQAAEVTANASKVEVSDDSLVFNASTYRVPEGSTLEALIKQLPGAKVDKEGNITINGKTVTKILIDGKEFFLNDNEAAMKNLPSDMIERIKTYERQSDLSRVTGINDGEEETVIDLTVKKGMMNGWYGNVNLGAGTQNRYAERFTINRFNDNIQATLLGGTNNVADMDFGGGGGRWGGWGNGLRKANDLGANYATTSDKLETGGSIRYRYDGSNNVSQSSTENFVATRGNFGESISQSLSSNARVNANFRLEWKPDTMTNIIFRPNFSYSRGRGYSTSSSGTFDEDPNLITNGVLDYNDAIARTSAGGPSPDAGSILDQLMNIVVNTNTSRSQSYNNNTNANGMLQMNRRFNSQGRNLTLRLNGSYSDSHSRQLSAANITYNTLNSIQQNNRYYRTPSKSHNLSAQLTYSEPIGDRTYLQLSYQFQYGYSRNDRRAYIYESEAYQDLSSALQANRYNIPAILRFMEEMQHVLDGTDSVANRLSQYSEYRNYNQTINISFRKVRDNYNFSVGLDAMPRRSTLNYKYMGTEYPEVTRNTFDLAPRINLRWNFDKQTNLNMRYNGRTSQPSMTNLLDIRDDSDPLNITRGNTGLKPSFSHNVNANFNTYNANRQQGIYTWAYFSTTRNSISNKTTYDPSTGVRTTRPMNINGNWYTGGGAGFNSGLGADKAFTIDIDADGSFNHNVGFYNNATANADNDDIKSITKQMALGGSLELSYRNKLFYAAVNGRLDYSHSKNNTNSFANQDTYNFSYGAEVEWTMPWGMSLNTDIGMSSRRGYAQSEMNTNELLWNAQLAQSFMRGNALTIMLEWNDILSQQTNISRNISALMRSDSRYNAIYSYGMLRVIYKFSIFGGKNAMGTDNERASERGGEWNGGWGGGGWR